MGWREAGQRRGRKRLVALIAVLSLVLVVGCVGPDRATAPSPAGGKLEIHFVDVGQGDAILLSSAGTYVLVDAGDRAAGGRLVDYLAGAGVDRLAAIFLTHPHADHVGGMEAVLETFQVGEVYDSAQVHTTRAYEDFLRIVDQKGIPYRAARRGMEVRLKESGVVISVLWPDEHLLSGTATDLNNNSVVLLVEHGRVRVLLSGDVEQAGEEALLGKRASLRAHVLKVAHHGGGGATQREFLGAVAPAVAVIMCGAGNPYDHPAERTLDSLRSAGVTVYRTDVHGTVVVESDGEVYRVRVEKGT